MLMESELILKYIDTYT